jgi:plastocyanin
MKILSKAFPIVAAAMAMRFGGPFSASAATYYVAYGDFYFSPSVLTIHVGDTVIWTNSTTSLIHTVTGLSPGEPLCGGSTVNACTNTFSFAGDFLYQCNFHFSLGMTGAVQALPLAPTSPVLTNGVWTNGNFVFKVLSTANQTNIVQAATNLGTASDWVSLDTNVLATNTFIFTDTNANQFPLRFYRVVNP